MIEHQVSHEVEFSAYTLNIFPGAKGRVNLPVIDD